MGRQARGFRAVVVILALAFFATTASAGVVRWGRLGRLQGTTGPQPAVAALAAHPTDPDILYAGMWLTTPGAALVYRSDDGGATWQPAANGLPGDLPANTGVADLLLDPTNPDVLYAALERRGLWRSDDSGATWSNIGDGVVADDENIVALALDPGPPATLYALSTDGFNVLGADTAWKVRNRGLPPAQNVVFNDVAFDPTDPDTVYIATSPAGLYRTTNGGRAWRQASSQMPGETHNVKQVTVSATGEVFASLRGVGLLRSDNQGQTWSQSQDGITFTNTLAGTISAPVFDPAEPDVALVYNSDGVFRSDDGGATWTRFNDGLSVTAVVTTLAFAPAQPHVALAGTAIAGVWAASEQNTDPPDPPDPTPRLLFMPVVRR